MNAIPGAWVEIVRPVRIDGPLRGQAISPLQPLFVFEPAGSSLRHQKQSVVLVNLEGRCAAADRRVRLVFGAFARKSPPTAKETRTVILLLSVDVVEERQ